MVWANERRRYYVTLSLIRQAHTQNDPRDCMQTWGMILGLRPANERQCYFVTMSLIGWAQT